MTLSQCPASANVPPFKREAPDYFASNGCKGGKRGEERGKAERCVRRAGSRQQGERLPESEGHEVVGRDRGRAERGRRGRARQGQRTREGQQPLHRASAGPVARSTYRRTT